MQRVAPSLPRSLPLPRGVRRLIAELVIADREKRGSDFVHVDRWPERISGFEDLAFLFSSTILGHGIASLRLDEAAYLYRLVRELKPDTAAEIGRYRGGSTFLIASALGTGTLHSYDIASRQGRRHFPCFVLNQYSEPLESGSWDPLPILELTLG